VIAAEFILEKGVTARDQWVTVPPERIREVLTALKTDGYRLLVFLTCVDHLTADRVVATQGVSDPVVGHEDARQVGMVVEDDPEHVVRLAFLPVGWRKDVVY